MSRHALSAQSRSDLDDIWLYIASDSVSAADRLIDRLVGKIQVLAKQPGMGRIREDLAETLRSYPVDNYVIFYRPTHDGIEIVRILSGFRDISSILAD